MRTTTCVEEVRALVRAARRDGRRVGCVPTMGSLHAGHTSLVAVAADECEVVVVTLYVNAPQFNDSIDFDRYPRPFEQDLAACEQLGVDLVFHPDEETIYPPGGETTVDVGGLGRLFEGRFRPGHFVGVATVVVKLLDIVLPDVAYFGLKDYQQQLVIRRLCRDLHLPVEIRSCPTIRDDDGLALSSRNVLLSPDERCAATALYAALCLARDRLADGETDLESIRRAMRDRLESQAGVQIDYATLADPETLEEPVRCQGPLVALVAAHVGAIRLIDNLPLPDSQSQPPV